MMIPSFKNKPEWINSGKQKVVLLMSGGVDSSAAALLLKERGYDLVGLTMLISRDESTSDSAAEVCEYLDIPHFSVDIQNEFKRQVSTPFCLSYNAGKTPNPCADCNENIKFGYLWDIARETWGDDFYLATGHYARIVRENEEAFLAKALYKEKDQSYFLSGIKKERLKQILFPLGDILSKEEVRNLVREKGLPVAERPDSMEICFANHNDYRSIITPSLPGNILNSSGDIIGEHNGIENYTVGQRKGIGITHTARLYVTAITPCDNTITVGEREFAFSYIVDGENLNILAEKYLHDKDAKLLARTRALVELVPCKVLAISDNNIRVEFEKPVFAPTPRQRLVIYTKKGIITAGAVILSQ